MDTHDKPADQMGPGVMLPDSTIHPADPELAPMLQQGMLQSGKVQDPKANKTLTPLQESLRRLYRDKRTIVSLGIIVFMILLAIIGPVIYQHIGGTYQLNGQPIGPSEYHSPFRQHLDYIELPASGQFWLGTDSVGHDLFARLMQSLLISITVALLVEVVDVALGVTIGVLAGYFGGWIDQILARFTDVMFAFPGILFAILITGIVGPATDDTLSKIPVIGANGNARLILVSLALAFTSWPIMARYVRGQTLQLKEQQFVEAARTSGTTNLQIIMRHIVPNLFSIVIIAATLNISATIVAEAGISELGLGVRAPGSSLGLMISDTLGSIDTSHPWEVLLPCIVLAIIVLAFSFLGDGLRDAFDPRSKD